jgi:hypothetical protein
MHEEERFQAAQRNVSVQQRWPTCNVHRITCTTRVRNIVIRVTKYSRATYKIHICIKVRSCGGGGKRSRTDQLRITYRCCDVCKRLRRLLRNGSSLSVLLNPDVFVVCKPSDYRSVRNVCEYSKHFFATLVSPGTIEAYIFYTRAFFRRQQHRSYLNVLFAKSMLKRVQIYWF